MYVHKLKLQKLRHKTENSIAKSELIIHVHVPCNSTVGNFIW